MAAHNKLTQKQIEAAKADGKQSKLADGGGLYLLLHPNGSKYWRMRYRHGGCEKTLALGVYPAVSLKQARELARAARAQTAAGIDPVAEHHRTRPGSGRSLPEIARAWYGSRQGQRADNTLEGDRRSLAYLTDYYKDNTDINDITTAGVSKFIEHLNRINIPACARRTVQILAQIWDYAVQRGIITDERRNPATTARPRPAPVRPPPAAACRPDRPPSVRTAFRPLARHRPHRPVMAHPRRRHEDQTPLYRPTVGLGSRNTPRAAHTDRRQHPPFPRHPPTAQTRPPSRPHQHQIRPQRHPTTGL
ncbi:TPA: DUF4102 domain-containing protein [Neisseria gonorrhoeae]